MGAQRFQVNSQEPEKVDNCAICLNNFKDKEVLVSLKCHEAHVFHEACINKWTENRLICPLCRNNLEVIHIEDDIQMRCQKIRNINNNNNSIRNN